jgi:NADP-dependent 3-hydroxy acid dehydrogenase YdfG
VDSQVALITGCSTGIGRATATELAQAGYEVVATARRPEELEGIGSARPLRLDVVDEASIKAAVQAVLERFGRIDVLVNNAGYAIRGAVEELDLESVKRMFDVNVNGIIRMVREVVPSMRARGAGQIVNIGSIGGKLASPANGSYTATKYAVEALSDAMRWELAPFGIKVILIEPGEIKSSFAETALRASSSVVSRQDSPYSRLYARLTEVAASQRVHEKDPEVVANAVLAALRAQRPRARYKVGVSMASRLAAVLPDRGKDALMRRLFEIGPSGTRPKADQANPRLRTHTG